MSQSETPNFSQTEPSPADISTSQGARNFLKTLKHTGKSGRNWVDNASGHVNSISKLLLSSTPGLFRIRIHDSLEPTSPCSTPHERSLIPCRRQPKPEDSWMEETLTLDQKQHLPGVARWERGRTKSKLIGLPVGVREQLSEFQLRGKPWKQKTELSSSEFREGSSSRKIVSINFLHVHLHLSHNNNVFFFPPFEMDVPVTI